MKQITIRIDDEQMEELKKISEIYKIKSVSWFIRSAIDLYLKTFYRKEDLK